MSLNARKELVLSLALRYHWSCKSGKKKILDELIFATGYHRKYAILLMNQLRDTSPAPKMKFKRRPPMYGENVKRALVQVWEASNRICSKRLAPFLPELVAVLGRHHHLVLDTETTSKLLSMSPATMDRILCQVRRGESVRGLSTTRAGSLLKKHIPIRTFFDWDEHRAGYVEVDLVAHCGTFVHGSYLNTLVMTDVATGWTEPIAIPYRSQDTVLYAMKVASQRMPFPIRGLDVDNGSEFINRSLIQYCQTNQITFTRCRPYKKNDQCHVEQKNSTVVRRFIGYDRYEGYEACRTLARLYESIRLYVNYFQPSMKLIHKHRQDGKVAKVYDRAQTPYMRVMGSDAIGQQEKDVLQAQYQELDPVDLFSQIEAHQDLFWRYAYTTPQSSDSASNAIPSKTKQDVVARCYSRQDQR